MTPRSSSHRFSPSAVCYRLIAIGSSALVFASAAVRAQNTPVGSWDCVMSGARQGLAYINFSDDFTFTAVEVFVPPNPGSKSQSLVNSIVPFPPDTSSGSQVSTIPTSAGAQAFLVQKVGAGQTVATNLYGDFQVGILTPPTPWGFDSQGRVIGFFTELLRPVKTVTCTTNTTVIQISQITTNSVTNTDGTITVYTTNITSYATNVLGVTCLTNFSTMGTNTVNFSGKVVPGKRLTLAGETPFGKFTIQGVPAVPLADLSSDSVPQWYGVKKQNGASFFEFFTLQPTDDPAFGPNIYVVSGNGAGYEYPAGLLIVSSQKRVALAFDIFDPSGNYQSTRAVTGPFNFRNLSGNASGIDSPPETSALTNRISFHIAPQPN